MRVVTEDAPYEGDVPAAGLFGQLRYSVLFELHAQLGVAGGRFGQAGELAYDLRPVQHCQIGKEEIKGRIGVAIWSGKSIKAMITDLHSSIRSIVASPGFGQGVE